MKPHAKNEAFRPRRWWTVYGVVMLSLVAIMVALLGLDHRILNTPSAIQPVESFNTPTPIPTLAQVVVIEAVEPGDELTVDNLRMQPVPAALALNGGYTAVTDVAGANAAYPIPAGAVVTSGLLELPAATPFVQATAYYLDQSAGAVYLGTPPPPGTLPTPTRVPSIQVVVPRYSIPAGTTLTTDDLMLENNFPAEYVPLSALTVMASAIGETTNTDLIQGTPLLAGALLPTNADLPSIPDGACTLTATEPGVVYHNSYDIANVTRTLRPATPFQVVDIPDAGSFQVGLPGGVALGTVYDSPALELNGNCDALR